MAYNKEIVEIYLRNYYLDNCKHKWVSLGEGNGTYECSKCGSCGGICWKCGAKVTGRKNKVFCRDCAFEIKKFILENFHGIKKDFPSIKYAEVNGL